MLVRPPSIDRDQFLDPTRGRPGPRTCAPSPRRLSNLGNGAAPAARFDAEVATARTRATSTAAFTRARLGSRADMETFVHLEMIYKDNFGCDNHGSPNPLMELSPIVWTSESTGTIGNAPFEIRLEPEGTYPEDRINVC